MVTVVRAAWLLVLGLAACVSPGDPIGLPELDGSGGGEGTSGGDGDTGAVLPDPAGPVGWASVSAEGQPGTDGGAGGLVVRVDTALALTEALARPEPLTVQVVGTLDGGFLLMTSDKTLEGLPGAALHGGLDIRGSVDAPVHNIIVRNLVVRGRNCADGCGDADAMSIRWAHHVWIDHCDISDGDDGNLDITREADYVTVSWSRFWYSSADRPGRYSNLIGGSDDDVADADDLKVTMHHNWWSDNVAGHMPRVRFGKVHVFDNYYDAVGNEHGVRVGVDADLRLENNHFDGIVLPVDEPIDDTAVMLVQGNLATPEPLADDDVGEAFVPPYPYTLDPPEVLAAVVPAGAGPP